MATTSLQPRGPIFALATSIAAVAALLGTAAYLFDQQIKIKCRRVGRRCFSLEKKPSLAAFKTLVEQVTLKVTYPLAKDVKKNIPIYDCTTLDLNNVASLDNLQDELYHVLTSGPGVFVLKSFFHDMNIIDEANHAYQVIIQRELEANGEKGDHFAQNGKNSRIWNSFSKHALQAPDNFVDYFSNPLFRTVCDAWLGPAYKITSQVNIVKPGGQAQVSHRDYHLGFQTTEDAARWPKAMHAASALLTLQGAIAHSDMPLESGPTRFLPFSQLFEEGYMAYRRPEFNAYFLENWVSLPLEKGDAVFFSPALFHAAGENTTTDFARSANLIQVSSPFGKTMETIDTISVIQKCYPALQTKFTAEGFSGEVDAFVRAVAEGYPFPTNLDRRPPAPGGMAPESEQDIVRRALYESWTRDQTVNALKQMQKDAAA